MVLSLGVQLGLNLVDGAVYSDSTSLQTAFSVFSFSDSMTSTAVGSALYAVTSLPAGSIILDYNIPFGSPLISPSVLNTYNSATYTYTCTFTGPYLFSVTAAVPTGQSVIIQLVGLDITPTIAQSVGSHNGVTTVARNFLLQCTTGTTVNVVLGLGQVTTGPVDSNLLSFVAFPYLPSRVSATSWAAYRSSSVDASFNVVSPVTFDMIHVNQGGVLNNNTGVVSIVNSGYYYVYITAGAASSKGTFVSLNRSTSQGQTSKLFAIYRTSTTASDVETIVQGRVVFLSAGDQLSMAVERGYVAFADSSYEISFFGFLLYYA
jgi:hypothetical protein